MEDMKMIEEMIEHKVMCNPGIVIGAQCIVEIKGHFFLLVELESKSGQTEFERVLVIEISAAAFQFLCEKGVKPCKVVHKIPMCHDKEVEIKCTFIVGDKAFIVVEVEGMHGCDKLVIVKSPICCVCD